MILHAGDLEAGHKTRGPSAYIAPLTDYEGSLSFGYREEVENL